MSENWTSFDIRQVVCVGFGNSVRNLTCALIQTVLYIYFYIWLCIRKATIDVWISDVLWSNLATKLPLVFGRSLKYSITQLAWTLLGNFLSDIFDQPINMYRIIIFSHYRFFKMVKYCLNVRKHGMLVIFNNLKPSFMSF